MVRKPPSYRRGVGVLGYDRAATYRLQMLEAQGRGCVESERRSFNASTRESFNYAVRFTRSRVHMILETPIAYPMLCDQDGIRSLVNAPDENDLRTAGTLPSLSFPMSRLR